MKIIKNPDKSVADRITSEVKANGGYCPCRIVKTEDTKCMCREFREQTTAGQCHCGLYEKIED